MGEKDEGVLAHHSWHECCAKKPYFQDHDLRLVFEFRSSVERTNGDCSIGGKHRCMPMVDSGVAKGKSVRRRRGVGAHSDFLCSFGEVLMV